jgi:DNA-binding PadR family transcriptional regulator
LRYNRGVRRGSNIDLGRFSDPGVLILASLAGGDKHGYALMQDIAEFSGTRLEPGTLYGALARLERRGWIAPLPVEGPRRPYQLTADGRTALREQMATMGQIVATGTRRLSPTGH